jgi:hypothetical protein
MSSFHIGGISFEYPAEWAIHDELPMTAGPGQMFALLGTVPWGACAPSDINCHYERPLEEGQIEVEVGRQLFVVEDGICGFAQERSDLAGRGPNDPQVAETRYFRIEGRPAIYTQFSVGGRDYYHSDEWRHWLIAEPASTQTVFTIRAKFRGPRDVDFAQTLDRLIETIRLGGPSDVGIPRLADCGAPFPAVGIN